MKRLVAAISLVACLLAPASAVMALPNPNPLNAACSAGANTSSACDPSNNGASNPLTGPSGLLKKITSIIAVVAGIAAVIVIIVGGFQYITSAGDAQKVSAAKNMILGAIIGLVIIIAAQSILLFVLGNIK